MHQKCIVLVVVLNFACIFGSSLSTFIDSPAKTNSLQKVHYPSGTLLRSLEASDGNAYTDDNDEERALFKFETLKKFIPGTTSWEIARAAKAVKTAEKKAKAQKIKEWVKDPKLYDKIASDDDALFKAFKEWYGLGYSATSIDTVMAKMGKTSPEYIQIFLRYKSYIATLQSRAAFAF